MSRSPGAKAVRTLGALLLAALALTVAPAHASDPREIFRQALRYDLRGGPEDAAAAFDLYRRAAEAGLPEAQFNVAVMLDSGRGVGSDLAQAATWYARAAAHGVQRAAYNLGQLYEAGQGVPRNLDLARAWFAASNLPAGRSRLSSMRVDRAKVQSVSAPHPVAPALGTMILAGAGAGSVELVWTSNPQPQRARFFVEVRAGSDEKTEEILADFVETSSIDVALPDSGDVLAWRVMTVAGDTGEYAASDWSYLRIRRN